MKAAPLLRVLGLGALVFGLTWLGAVAYWRAAGAEVTAGRLVAWLLVLPLLLLGVVLGGRALLRRRRTAGAAGKNEAPPVAAAASGPRRPLLIHSTATWTRLGTDPAALADALARPTRPPLHPDLRDSMGLPVFAAGIEEADPGSVAHVLAAGPGGLRNAAPLHALRALALLDPVAEALLLAARALDAAEAPPRTAAGTADGLHPHAMHHSRSAQSQAETPWAPPLQVHLLLPASWAPTLHEAAVARVVALAGTAGLGGDRVAVQLHSVAEAGQCWHLLDRLAAADPEPGARHLLLATDSMLDPRVIAQLEAQGALLVSGHPEGRIPGEAAAGLLLTPAGDSADPDRPLRLHACCHAPASRGRAAAADSARLLRTALEAATLQAGPDILVFTDADHRPSRAVEAAGAITGALPESDPVEVARHLGIACGDTGIAAPLVLLAAAAAQVRQAGAPMLVLALAGDTRRTALALSAAPEAAGHSAAVADPSIAEAVTA
ncbi:hypothetical protein LY625_05920 [Lysobacter sp. GX 14042]|uniref:hypothetical protein n=1 Tax=Lysobacter sp. GX 14042 TaxID=2907155 RepID=UPI001F3A5959|nr:hypothetical protein [Lysobacter sp. GX 14042]MCE7032158.1 hypothetical protein [Lysobacter sp. GX 14042]